MTRLPLDRVRALLAAKDAPDCGLTTCWRSPCAVCIARGEATLAMELAAPDLAADVLALHARLNASAAIALETTRESMAAGRRDYDEMVRLTDALAAAQHTADALRARVTAAEALAAQHDEGWRSAQRELDAARAEIDQLRSER